MPRILDTIQDCACVFVARIGEGPTEKLAQRGIVAVTDYPWQEVEIALSRYLQERD